MGQGHLRIPVMIFAAFAIFTPPVAAAGEHPSSPPLAAADSQATNSSGLETLYRQRAESNPNDVEALEKMATLQIRHGDYTGAIAAYRHLLEILPNDHDATVGMARALGWMGQYDAARRLYQNLLQRRPDDTDALEGLARIDLWGNRPQPALAVFKQLAARYPANPEYALGLARVEMNLRQYSAARETLTALLSMQPRNRDAQLQLADLELYEGHQKAALQRFNHLVSQDPTNRAALEGNARIAYYRGDLVYAQQLTAKLVEDDPRDVSSLLLLARLERALHHPRQARALIGQVEILDSRNADARDLANSLYDDARPTMHTSAYLAREVSDSSSPEALSSYGYENTWRFAALPRSDSYVSLGYLPSQSPSGGIRGAVAPSEIVYRQTLYLTANLTLHGGAGLARFGPGSMEGIPSQAAPIASAGFRPVGFADLSYALGRKLSVSFSLGRSAIPYTPITVRLGVVEDRLSLGMQYKFTPKTEIRVEPFVMRDSTVSFRHQLNLVASNPTFSNHSDFNRGAGSIFTLNRRLLQKSRLAFDLGYDGLVYGYSGGGAKPYLGFFNPAFYQRHYLTTHLAVNVRGPLGFDFSSGAGVQQVERSTPLRPAMLLSPGVTFKATRQVTIGLGYTHYNASQSLGRLHGDSIRLTTDWKF